MKTNTLMVILLCIATLNGGACKGETFVANPLKDLTCKIITKNAKGCTGIPTLQHGVLKLFKRGEFEIEGHYDACFFLEDVIITGKIHVNKFDNGMNLELLSTNRTRRDGATEVFPRTFGFIGLNFHSLEGHLIDISAVIRSRDDSEKNVVTAKLECEPSE